MRVSSIVRVIVVIVGLLTAAACAPASATPPAATPTQANTPTATPAAFTTSNLIVTPDIVKPGEPATVGVTVTNTGGEQGTYTIMVKLHNGTIVGMQDVTLAGGTSKNVALSISLSSAGTHMIMVDDLDRNLVVQASSAMTPAPTTPTPAPTTPTPAPTTPTPAPTTPKPAAFATSALTISPSTVKLGGMATVNVTVTNNGEQAGTYKVVLKVDGTPVNSKDVTLAGGASQKVTLACPMTLAVGTHVVAIEQFTGNLVVQPASTPEMPGMDSCAGM